MKHALGWLINWDLFAKARIAKDEREVAQILHDAHKHDPEASRVVLPVKAPHQSLPHSHEDTVVHQAVHGHEEEKGHEVVIMVAPVVHH